MTSKTDADPYELKRFVDAQSTVYAKVTEELSAGRKRSHWMWFVFPQIAGLGFSAMAQRFAIGSKAEAAAFLAHDILGPRLVECTRLVMAASDQPIGDILGSPDDEVPVVDDAVRCDVDARDLRRSDRHILSGRQRSVHARHPAKARAVAAASGSVTMNPQNLHA